MKTVLLLLVFVAFNRQGQTTYNLDWEVGSLSSQDLSHTKRFVKLN